MKRTGISRRTPLKHGTTRLTRHARLAPINVQAQTKRQQKQRAYYASAAWKSLRRAALERAGHRCEFVTRIANPAAIRPAFNPPVTFGTYSSVGYGVFRCVETTALHVHHKGSKFGGDESVDSLEVLCKAHHMAIHASRPNRARALARAGGKG